MIAFMVGEQRGRQAIKIYSYDQGGPQFDLVHIVFYGSCHEAAPHRQDYSYDDASAVAEYLTQRTRDYYPGVAVDYSDADAVIAARLTERCNVRLQEQAEETRKHIERVLERQRNWWR